MGILFEYFIHARNNKLAKYNVQGKGSLVHFTSYTNTLMSEQEQWARKVYAAWKVYAATLV